MIDELRAKLNAEEKRVIGIPRQRLYLYGAIAVFIPVYLVYSFWPRKTIPPGVMQTAKPVIKADKIEMPGPKVIRVIDKQTVYKYLPSAQIAPTEQVIDTADIPAAQNGVQTVTTIDQETGEARTQYQEKSAPWFALERSNELGVGYGIGTSGRQLAGAHYRRDLFRIKDVHVSGQVEINAEMGGTTDGRATIQANWRF
jgi:hypothetical protein